MPAEYDPAEVARLETFMDGYRPPSQGEINRRMWESTINISEASKRVAQRQLSLLRTQAEIIGDQMIAEQHKIDKADYDIRNCTDLIVHYEEHPDGRS